MKEKKKTYKQPTQLTTKYLKDVLGTVLKDIYSSYNNYLENFIKEWPKIIGNKYAFMTKIVGYKQGILTIKVTNSSLYSLLYHHKKQEILEKIKRNYPNWYVKSIVFKI